MIRGFGWSFNGLHKVWARGTRPLGRKWLGTHLKTPGINYRNAEGWGLGDPTHMLKNAFEQIWIQFGINFMPVYFN